MLAIKNRNTVEPITTTMINQYVGNVNVNNNHCEQIIVTNTGENDMIYSWYHFIR